MDSLVTRRRALFEAMTLVPCLLLAAIWLAGFALGGAIGAESKVSGLLPALQVAGHRPRPSVPPARARYAGSIAASLATTAAEIEGRVTSPILGNYNPGTPSSFAFTFTGSVNVDPSEWYLGVDVLNPAAADPADENNWWYNRATFRAEGGGPDVFTFSETGITPFADLPDAWRVGGLGRMRVVVVSNDGSQWAALPIQDAEGNTPANATTIVVADTAPDPTKPPGESSLTIKNPLNPATPNYLSVNSGVLSFPPGQLAQQQAATNNYYSQVKVGSRGTGLSIRDKISTLRKFIDFYFRPFECGSILNEPQRVTKYFNKGDLGIGREMHCLNRGCTGELVCYVKNFGKADGTAVFNDKTKAKLALQANRPFATVAMVERQLMAPDAANRVFFVVYEYTAASGDPAKTKLALKAQLDNKGYNTSIPGNCLQCHGINSTYTAHSAHQVKNAMFLPFDLDAFDYFSSDPSNVLSRAKQESAFRAHNRMVRSFSSLNRSSDAQAVIGGWYGGDLFSGTFNGAFVPPGWLGDTSQSQLYRKLVAIGCRTCHISYLPFGSDQRSFLNFASSTTFAAQAKAVLCNDGVPRMPAAEQTLKIVWQSAGRPHLYGQGVGLFGDCGLD